MKKRRELEVLARGVCVKRGKLLVCRSRGASHVYLPGGHVEFGEDARGSLVRELREELGAAAKVGRFLGAVEHAFGSGKKRCCEVNLLFEVRLPGLDVSRAPRSREAKLRFEWIPFGARSRRRLEPSALCRALPAWLRSSRGPERWATTYGLAAGR